MVHLHAHTGCHLRHNFVVLLANWPLKVKAFEL